MGSSLTNFRGFGFWARDGHLELWLRALAHEIDKVDLKPRWLKEARDHWHLQGAGYFTGWISPNLDKIIIDNDRRDIVRRLSEAALDHLRSQGAELSLGYLDSIDVRDFGAPPPSAKNVELGEKWLRLLGDDCAADSDDAWNRIQVWPPVR